MKNKKLKLYRESESGNYVVTLAIGKDYIERWETLSLPLWSIYCSIHSLGLAALVEPYEDKGNKRFDWQKLLVGRALVDGGCCPNGICFVDYDLIPNPFSPNIFDEWDQNKVGFVSQRQNLPYRDIESVLRRVAFWRHSSSRGMYPLDSYLTATPERVFIDHELPPHGDYGCGGLFLFNNDKHSKFIESIFTAYSKNTKLVSNEGEEVYLNHHFQNSNLVQWLDYSWHTLWFYEMAWCYPWLYDKNNRNPNQVEEAIVSTLSRTNFMHFVGSWEKWAWMHAKTILSERNLMLLEKMASYQSVLLKSPPLGFKFPSDSGEYSMLSK